MNNRVAVGIYKRILAYKKNTFYRAMPSNLDPQNLRHFENNSKYKCPDLHIYYFKSINSLPDSTLFRSIFPLDLSFPYFQGRIQHHNIKGIYSIRKNWKSICLNKHHCYLIIHDPWTKNYYHWMTQALPRLLLALRMQSNFTLLLPEDHCAEFHVRSLEILGVSNRINLSINNKYYKIYNLIYPSHDIQIGDYHDTLIQELALRLRSPNRKEGLINLFVHRASKGQRSILNEEQVLNTFLSFGFKIVEFEHLSFDEQIALASQASVLAGVHGAGLTNMMFMPEGSKVLELTTRLNGDQYYYFTLSNALGHDYYYQLCESDSKDKRIQEANLLVDIEKLKRNIELMLAKNNA